MSSDFIWRPATLSPTELARRALESAIERLIEVGEHCAASAAIEVLDGFDGDGDLEDGHDAEWDLDGAVPEYANGGMDQTRYSSGQPALSGSAMR
jgi:hypothetical protein